MKGKAPALCFSGKTDMQLLLFCMQMLLFSERRTGLALSGKPTPKWALDLRVRLFDLVSCAYAVMYRWRELPQVSFLSRQKFCGQKYACREESFVAKKIMFVATKPLSRHISAATNIILEDVRVSSRQK